MFGSRFQIGRASAEKMLSSFYSPHLSHETHNLEITMKGVVACENVGKTF